MLLGLADYGKEIVMDKSSKPYFEAVASQWDRMRSGFFPDSLREVALNAAAVEVGRTAVDVGAGAGFIAQGLIERGLKVIAVDQSPAMLAELQRRLPAVECRTGEADRLPVEDVSVDYVFANMYLHHVPDPANALREMGRILRPGGVLVLTDLDSHDHEFLREEQHDLWLGFDRRRIGEWLAAAGLSGVEVNCASSDCCAASEKGSDQAAISIFLARGVKV